MFEPKVQLTKSLSKVTPSLAGSDQLRLEAEIRRINARLDRLVESILEIRQFLSSMDTP